VRIAGDRSLNICVDVEKAKSPLALLNAHVRSVALLADDATAASVYSATPLTSPTLGIIIGSTVDAVCYNFVANSVICAITCILAAKLIVLMISTQLI